MQKNSIHINEECYFFLKLDYANGGVNIVFKLLERPNVQGNVENPVAQMTLDEAVILIRDLVNSGQLTLPFNKDQITATKFRFATYDAESCIPLKQNIGISKNTMK